MSISRDIIRTVTTCIIRLKAFGRAKLDVVIEGLDVIKPSFKGVSLEEFIIIKKKVRVFTNRA